MSKQDKLGLIARRKQELDHAIKNGFDQAQIALRAERVRAAVLTALKKYRVRSTLVDKKPVSTRESKWANVPTDEIIEVTRLWKDRPTLGDIAKSVREIAEGEIVGATPAGRLVKLANGDVIPAVFQRSRRFGCLFGTLVGWKVKVEILPPPKPAKIIDLTMPQEATG